MTVKDLQRLCKQGEHQFIEFKQYASEPDQITEEIVGFLNAEGGKLLIGVKDDGELIGLKYPEDDLNFLTEYFSKKIKPQFELVTTLVPVSAKRSVIVCDIPEGIKKPYFIKQADSNRKQVFFRVEDENLKASRELKNILYQKSYPQERTIVYSELEASVLKEIEQNEPITKAELVRKTEFNSRKVSDCLIRLVTSKVLRITPAASGDLFEFNHSS